MFGSDQTLFPQAIGLAIAAIDQAPFLTTAQKRDILYNNAARFLRLTRDQIAADHRPIKIGGAEAPPFSVGWHRLLSDRSGLLVPAAAATSAAKSLSFFSMPSPS